MTSSVVIVSAIFHFVTSSKEKRKELICNNVLSELRNFPNFDPDYIFYDVDGKGEGIGFDFTNSCFGYVTFDISPTESFSF